jgi:hypothetical protein
MIFRPERCDSTGLDIINGIVKHEKEYKKNGSCLVADKKRKKCHFAGETNIVKIMAASTHSNEFVEFDQNKSLPKWLKDNGLKTNHDFDGRGKLCHKRNY